MISLIIPKIIGVILNELSKLKKGPVTRDEAMMAVGAGRMDITAVIDAAGDNVEWLIVELDRCATDMMEAVEKSYEYLVGAKLARGGGNN